MEGIKFSNFFKDDTKESMARLLSFLCSIVAMITSVAAIWLGLHNSLDSEYVYLVVGLWAAAFGGKNWAKSVENKKNIDAK